MLLMLQGFGRLRQVSAFSGISSFGRGAALQLNTGPHAQPGLHVRVLGIPPKRKQPHCLADLDP